MKVAVYHNNKDVRIEERPIPKIKEGEILVKVKASGICGTDVMEWYRIKKAPRILGHEIAGIIEESKSELYQEGQRVFVSHHVPCNKCKYCLEGNHTACETLHKGNYDPGGYSEYIRIPEINVKEGTYLLPDSVSFEEATMIEPLACTVRGQRIINLKPTHTVLILGSGVSGLTHIQLAKLKGAKVIATDIDPYRLKKAEEAGADEVIDVRRNCSAISGTPKNPQDFFSVSKQQLKLRADRIIICTGAKQAVEQAFNCIDKKGIILFFAIPKDNPAIPIVDFWRNELTIMSSYGAAPEDLKESLKLISENKVNVKSLITHRLPLKEIQKGFRIVEDAKESLKVVLIPHTSS